jgi:DNA-directed RNA polymerase specialized sigma24 family protein
VTDETGDIQAKTAATAAAEQAAAELAAAELAAAFTRGVAAYHDDMTRVAFVVSGDVELAREATQAAWAKIWHTQATMRNRERVRAWVMGIAAVEARQLATDGSRNRGGVAGDTGLVATRASAAPAYRSDQLALANALAPLDTYDRMIVALRYVSGLSEDEIGVELAMPGGAVRARVAKVLSRLLTDLHGAPTDTIDAFEHGLTERVRSFGDIALAPFDAAMVAKAAIETVPRATVGDRLAELLERLPTVDRRLWIAAAGILAVVLVFNALGRGGSGGAVALATPIPTDATRRCEPPELNLKITSWQGEPAHRSASVEMKNISNGACLIDSLPEPWLVDGVNFQLLIGQDQASALMRIGPGDVLKTRVGVRNYCGAAPKAPIKLVFRQGTSLFIAQPLSADDVSGVPTCGGTPQSTGDIGMAAWAP